MTYPRRQETMQYSTGQSLYTGKTPWIQWDFALTLILYPVYYTLTFILCRHLCAILVTHHQDQWRQAYLIICIYNFFRLSTRCATNAPFCQHTRFSFPFPHHLFLVSTATRNQNPPTIIIASSSSIHPTRNYPLKTRSSGNRLHALAPQVRQRQRQRTTIAPQAIHSIP